MNKDEVLKYWKKELYYEECIRQVHPKYENDKIEIIKATIEALNDRSKVDER